MLDKLDISVNNRFRHLIFCGIEFHFIQGRGCTHFINGFIQKIPGARFDFPDRPAIPAYIIGKVNTGCPVCKNDLNGCKGKEKPAETEKPAELEKPKKETGSVGTILFILAALLAVGGIGYYVKIVRPKQQAEDDAEFEDDGYGEGFDPDEAYGEPEYLSEDDFDDKDSK